MNRRNFLSGLGALVGGVLLDKAVPLGRVWSFPKEVKCLNVAPIAYSTYIVGEGAILNTPLAHMATIYYDKVALKRLEDNFSLAAAMPMSPEKYHAYGFASV